MRDTETSGPVLPDNKRLAYRVSYIPEDFNINEATIFLRQCLAVMDLDVESLVMDSNGRHAQIATITLKTLSEKLQGDTDEWEIRSFASKSTYSHIVVDKHFYGFTPLYAPNEEEHTVDCIAISGLGGHAFGSWKARNSSYMWLRDALPRDLPKARVLIYGYESSVSKSKSFQNLGDIASSFRASLREVRSSRRPVIFIAHSLGGLVLKQALVQMAASEDEDDACHLKATSDVLFFGVPNQGMELSSLYPMAHGQLNLAFLSTLDKNSIYLQSLMTEFNKLDLSDTRIMSFYETSTSPTARQVSSGKWSMSDEYAMLVDRYSATSGRSWNNTLPINRNHSDMVKYTRRDTVYDTVCRYLKESARRAPAAIYQKPKYLVASTSPSALVRSPEDRSANLESLRPTRSLSNLPKTNDMTTLPFREYKLSKSIESSNISNEAVIDGTDARTHHVIGLQEQQRALQVLSAAGFDVKATYYSPAEALLWAVQNGNKTVVQWLLQGGKENALDVISYFQLVLDQQRLLHIAASKNFRVIARLLLDRGANINTKDNDGRTSLHCAVAHEQEAMVRLLLDEGADVGPKDNDGCTSLHVAAQIGQESTVRLLLERDADINARERDSMTALHCATQCGHVAVVRLLLEKGTDINARKRDLRTTLHCAILYGHVAVVRLLLEKGADINAKDDRGVSSLSLAVSLDRRAILCLLLERGADSNAEDVCGRTSLHTATSSIDEALIRLLLEKGADINAKTLDGTTAVHLAANYDPRPIWCMERKVGTLQEKEAIVRLLQEKGADINAKTRKGTTPLHLVALTGYEAIAKILLENGSDLHAVNSAGVTALHSAADVGHKSIVQLLLEKGANPNARNDHGETSLDLARRRGKENVIELLEPITEKALNKFPWGFGWQWRST